MRMCCGMAVLPADLMGKWANSHGQQAGTVTPATALGHNAVFCPVGGAVAENPIPDAKIP